MNKKFSLQKKHANMLISFSLIILIVICILLLQIKYEVAICIGSFFMKISPIFITILLSILFGLLVVYLLYHICKKDNNEFVKKFVKPFLNKKDLLYAINVVISIPCIIALIIHLFCHSDWGNEFSFFNISSLLLCILSIYFTCRVYFEIDKAKTNTLDDYLERLTDIISNSKKGDKVMIIAPTIILGQVKQDESSLKNMYLNDIYSFLNSKGKICFVLLDWDINGIDCFTIKSITSERTTSFFYETNNSIKKDLFDYHIQNWGLYLDTPQKIGDAMNKSLLENMERLTKYDNSSFIRLKKEMFCVEGGNSSGFFAVVNFTRGIYYMGSFSVSDKSQKFQGTYFENEHIEKQMRHMLRCAVEEYCIDDDKEKLTNIFEE